MILNFLHSIKFKYSKDLEEQIKELAEQHFAIESFTREESLNWIRTCCDLLDDCFHTKTNQEHLIVELKDKLQKKTLECINKEKSLDNALEQIKSIESAKTLSENNIKQNYEKEQEVMNRVVRRAIRLSRFIGDLGEDKNYPLPNKESNIEYWNFIDSFIEQLKDYINRAEETKKKLGEFGEKNKKFMKYVKKEVNELNKFWQLVEEKKLHKTYSTDYSPNNSLKEIVEKLQKENEELKQEVEILKNTLTEYRIKLEPKAKNRTARQQSLEQTQIDRILSDRKKLLTEVNKAISIRSKELINCNKKLSTYRSWVDNPKK